MTEDSTLSDFASSSSDEPAESSGVREESERTDGTDTASEPESATPPRASATDGPPEAVATPTTTFASGDYECAGCGRTTDRVWRADGEYVCPSCKRW